MKIIKLILAFAVIINIQYAYTQVNPGHNGGHTSEYEVQLIPNNPEVSSLGRYGQNPINKYNGSANVSIPIHTVDLDGLQIPIALNYNTSGIRVNQEASWVGLGWSLSEGIAITREINGFDDFRPGTGQTNLGWLHSGDMLPPTSPEDDEFKLDKDELWIMDQEASRDFVPRDVEPDLFTANTPSGMVKFYLPKIAVGDTVLQAETFGERNFKVEYHIGDQVFTLTDPKGYIYHFDQKEYSTSYVSNNQPSSTVYDALTLVSDVAKQQAKELLLTWKVSEIESPYNIPGTDNAVLKFSYANGFFINYPHFSETYNIDPVLQQSTGIINYPDKLTASVTSINTLYLQEISGDFGKLTFELGPRDDAFTILTMYNLRNSFWSPGYNPDGDTQHSLQKVEFRDIYNNLVKTAQFNYSYFNDGLTVANEETYFRLKLDSVSIQDRTYKFEYESPDGLPAKDSPGIDFWGFYNGRDNSVTRIPTFNRFMLVAPNGQNGGRAHEVFFKWQGADRSSDFNYGKRGLLKKVIYPTGGSTEFIYEPHAVTLKKNHYTPTFYPSDGLFRSSGLSGSQAYNFRYQQLKLAEDSTYSLEDFDYIQCSITPSSVTASQSGTAFQVTEIDLCDNAEYFDAQGNLRNVEVSATFSCSLNCGNSYPSGRAVWVVNTDTGQETTIFSYDGKFTSGYYPPTLTTRIGLPLGNYKLYQQQWSTGSGPNTSVATVSGSATIWSGNQVAPPVDVYEEFEVGGARIFQTLNKDVDGNILEIKQYSYDKPFDGGSSLSSGVLMDDLVFWSPAGSLFEYSEDTAIFESGFYFSSDNRLRTQNAAAGSHIGYDRVIETVIDGVGASNGYTVTNYVNRPNDYLVRSGGLSQVNDGQNVGDGSSNPYVDPENLDQYSHYDVIKGNGYMLGKSPNTHAHINGSVVSDSIFSASNQLKRVVHNEYEEYHIGKAPYIHYPSMNWLTTGYLIASPYELMSPSDHRQGYIKRLKSSRVEDFYSPGNTETLTEYFYESPEHYQLTRSVQYNSNGRVLTNKVYYPQNLPNEPNISDLIAQNRMAQNIRTERFIGTPSNPEANELALQVTTFAPQSSMGQIAMTHEVKSLKGDFDGPANPVQTRLVYEEYDVKGNPVQYRKANGPPISLIWGYQGMYPVIKIENLTHGLLESTVHWAVMYMTGKPTDVNNLDDLLEYIGDLQTATQRQVWQNFNIKLRESSNLASALVTTYSYSPGIGMTSMTDARGYTTHYQYDTNNRLEFVKDANLDPISENKYNYQGN